MLRYPYTEATLDENVICHIPERCLVLASCGWNSIRYAFKEYGDDEERIIVGKTVGDWCEKIVSFVFSPFPGYYYNMQTSAGTTFCVNGERSSHMNAYLYDVTIDGVPFFSVKDVSRDSMKLWTFLGDKELEYTFSDHQHLSQDMKSIIYVGRWHSTQETFRTMIDERIYFDGVVDSFRINRDLGLWSYMGLSNPDLDQWILHLNSAPSDYSVPRSDYAKQTLVVNDDHSRFFHALRNVDGKGMRVVVDGSKQSQYLGVPISDEVKFSANSEHCAFLAHWDKKSSILVEDGEILFEHDCASHLQYAGNTLTWIARDGQGLTVAKTEKLWRTTLTYLMIA